MHADIYAEGSAENDLKKKRSVDNFMKGKGKEASDGSKLRLSSTNLPNSVARLPVIWETGQGIRTGEIRSGIGCNRLI